jgi:pentatricopeptide repeat protein
VFKDPELEDFFAQLGTYQILMDLLFENGRYQDILEVFEIIKQRQHQEAKYPKNVVILTFAACFKLVSASSRIMLLLRCCYFSRHIFNEILQVPLWLTCNMEQV